MSFVQQPLLLALLLASFLAQSVYGSLSISEFLAINGSGLEDKDGDGSDWIEIHNDDDAPVNLTGWHLTDDPDNLTKWKIPKGSVKSDGYALIHASGKDSSSIFSPEIHSNFSLNSDGEYLALVEPDGITIAHEYAPGFPEQHQDVSYGIGDDGTTVTYLSPPTPGKANGPAIDGLLSGVTFSVKRGYYDEPIMLELTSDTPDAQIRYTDNGAVPSLFTAKTYSGPISIDKTTTIRASANKSGYIGSKLKTHTYIFVNDVIKQESMATKITEDPVYGPLMRDALLKYPAISLVTPDTDISKTSEDPTSVEMVFPDGSKGFQIDAGVKRVGGHSLNAYPKNNMRLYFRSGYGKEKLSFPLYEDHPYTDEAANTFDQLNLRGGSHDSLFYLGAASPPQAPSNGQYLRNRWINDIQFLMGHESVRGRWVHVYINGNYWGHYQLMERPTQDYFASYLGGKKEDYVAVNRGQGIGASDMSAWTAMRSAAKDYSEFQRRVDVLNYVDYMLLNYYCGNDWDWNPEQNWAGGGSVEPDAGGMKFIAWDSDIIFRRLNDNNLGKAGPHNMFTTLIKQEDFAILVADRIQKHFYNDGLLTPSRVAEVYNKRAEEIRLSIIPETARWEGGRWTRDNQWQAELDRLNDDFFPNRTPEILNQFKSKGWLGVMSPPSINQAGGYVDADFKVALSKSIFASGKIVYTTDGTDPRLSGGTRAATALDYDGPITLTGAMIIKARVAGTIGWSALIEARFVVDQVPASADNLTISKLHYRPAAASPEEVSAGFQSRGDFEFIELSNLGSATIDLHEVRLNHGVTFDFASASIQQLAPGDRLFLVKNHSAFAMRFGPDLPIAGEFQGSLSNDGERLQIVNADDVVLQELTYNDAEPWPTDADGDGSFLTLRTSEKAMADQPAQWRAQTETELSGSVPVAPSPELTEFVFGNRPKFRMERLGDGSLLHEVVQRADLNEVSVTVEVSNDLVTWTPLPTETVRVTAPNPDHLEFNNVIYSWDGDDQALYLRHRIKAGE